MLFYLNVSLKYIDMKKINWITFLNKFIKLFNINNIII